MQNITIGRYPNANELGFAGWIEGAREDGSTWIMWLDDHGDPCTYWPKREPSGAVVGDPVMLAS